MLSEASHHEGGNGSAPPRPLTPLVDAATATVRLVQTINEATHRLERVQRPYQWLLAGILAIAFQLLLVAVYGVHLLSQNTQALARILERLPQ